MQFETLNRPLEIKAVSDSGHFSGYGSVFDVVDRAAEVVERGAFTHSLAVHQSKGTLPALLWQHKADEPIGVFKTMREDTRGLYVEGQLAIKTARGAEAYEFLAMGAVRGLSIGYTVPVGGSETKHNVRRLKQVNLMEVSVVTMPCNEEALISEVKTAMECKTELERFLRNVGMSRAQAKALIAGGYSYLNPRQADADHIASIREKARSLSATILNSIQ